MNFFFVEDVNQFLNWKGVLLCISKVIALQPCKISHNLEACKNYCCRTHLLNCSAYDKLILLLMSDNGHFALSLWQLYIQLPMPKRLAHKCHIHLKCRVKGKK